MMNCYIFIYRFYRDTKGTRVSFLKDTTEVGNSELYIFPHSGISEVQ